jgi:hypothetical protein
MELIRLNGLIELIADCGLPTADCRLRTADCGLPTADCRLPTAAKKRLPNPDSLFS